MTGLSPSLTFYDETAIVQRPALPFVLFYDPCRRPRDDEILIHFPP